MDMNKIPSQLEIDEALVNNNLKSCRNTIIKPVSFSVTICGEVKRNTYSTIENELTQAWHAELALSGVVGSGSVRVHIQDQQEYLSDDAYVFMFMGRCISLTL